MCPLRYYTYRKKCVWDFGRERKAKKNCVWDHLDRFGIKLFTTFYFSLTHISIFFLAKFFQTMRFFLAMVVLAQASATATQSGISFLILAREGVSDGQRYVAPRAADALKQQITQHCSATTTVAVVGTASDHDIVIVVLIKASLGKSGHSVEAGGGAGNFTISGGDPHGLHLAVGEFIKLLRSGNMDGLPARAGCMSGIHRAHAAGPALGLPTGFVADTAVLKPSRNCSLRSNSELRELHNGYASQVGSTAKHLIGVVTGRVNNNDCAFMPLPARQRPGRFDEYLLAMFSDALLSLNQSLHLLNPATRWDVMPWAGSLLGAYRDKDIIAHTHDGDMLIPPELEQELRKHSSPAIKALFEVGIITWLDGELRRFCYHERAPRLTSCPGSWGSCGNGRSYINCAYNAYVDGYTGHLKGETAVSVQFNPKVGCVTPTDLLSDRKTTVTLRGIAFLAPKETEKVLTANYGWDWRLPDPLKRPGNMNDPSWKANVCAWPNRTVAGCSDLPWKNHFNLGCIDLDYTGGKAGWRDTQGVRAAEACCIFGGGNRQGGN